ncbi:Glucose-6-phosphate 3-dehydrogenase [Planctomycetes bacterium Pla163]|uniref:Glucose-6-phosphate 3-dehydrogenase n=1 Tax=Rohdeia mirabilis TaxID=2528008 RepID=A0A518D4F8_9BACT|nr:Glucose-6-phosphate 3-dehydrogenase [Planctomycetes bacterium Pla163]
MTTTSDTPATVRPLRLGMVGGGPGAFIGAVHRIAARLDGAFELVAGAFSSDHGRCLERAAEWNVEPERAYASWQDLLRAESERPADERVQVVVVVTPNHLHHEIAIAALEAGFDVACDKPLTTSSALADEIARAVERTGRRFLVTHNYTGYPLVREARALIARGDLGELRRVDVEYVQGWLAEDLAAQGQKQAAWRADPALAGPGGALGDIGTHAFNLAEFVCGARVERLFGRRHSFVAGRAVDDDAEALLELTGGVRGTLRCSQVCVGRENGLVLSVFGTRGGLTWRQEHPNDLELHRPEGGLTVKRTANADLSPLAAASARTPPGHPQGFLEAFANLYRDLATAIRAEAPLPDHLPSVTDGVRGVRFVEAVIESDARGWVEL